MSPPPPWLVRGALGAVLGMSVDAALILGLHIQDVVVALAVAVASGLLSGLTVSVGLRG